MSAAVNTKRLEAEVKKLNTVINELVEENYWLKSLLTQLQNKKSSTQN